MGEYEEERHEDENGGDTYTSSAHPHRSKSHRGSRDHDRESCRSGEKDRERDRDHRRHHRHHRERKDRGRDDDCRRGRDYDREDRHNHRYRFRSRSWSTSPSRGRSEHRSRLRSRSKSKRVSGFDIAPPPSAMSSGASAVTGQITGANPVIPGVIQNTFPLATSQPFSALPVIPVHAMTQQDLRHFLATGFRISITIGLAPISIISWASYIDAPFYQLQLSSARSWQKLEETLPVQCMGEGDAVVNVYVNHEKKFAFLEMRSVEEASNAMALDGIIFQGASVKVRRPTDYNPSQAAFLGPSLPNPNLNLAAVGLIPGSACLLECPDRIFVGGLPYYCTENQIRELLETFGPLRGFDMVKDRETGNSKGYAFCVYQDLAMTDAVCTALDGIKLGDKTLTVRRANQGANQPKPEQENVLRHLQQQIALQKLLFQPALVATKVVCLSQAVSPDELKDDEAYEEIIDDMRQECSKFGTLVNVVIPRPQANGELPAGVGKVFLEYADTDGSTKALAGLNGRKFDGNQLHSGS
ncbi:hypothetical protein RIF29_23304 [Crotalaria pallida]|uniref:Splicing factor U2af large subunit n=1 Tax=Crotalaria pallida TaxID=3830 RepID=A0AAN9I9V9_CROPI